MASESTIEKQAIAKAVIGLEAEPARKPAKTDLKEFACRTDPVDANSAP